MTHARRTARKDLAWLSWSLAAAVAAPWLIGLWCKTGLQPGLVDNAARASLLVDFVVIGTIVFGIALWMVAAFALWIVRAMQGGLR
jgi:hypothetical protein